MLGLDWATLSQPISTCNHIALQVRSFFSFLTEHLVEFAPNIKLALRSGLIYNTCIVHGMLPIPFNLAKEDNTACLRQASNRPETCDMCPITKISVKPFAAASGVDCPYPRRRAMNRTTTVGPC